VISFLQAAESLTRSRTRPEYKIDDFAVRFGLPPRVFPSSHFRVCSLDSLGCRMWVFIPLGTQ
jgi:hypothetical protein